MPALRKTTDSWTSRQQNQLSAISEYTTYVRNIAGKDNQVADALSRITIDAVELAQCVDFHAMALAQDSDDAIIHLRNDPATALRLENVRLNSTTSLLCDTSTGVQCPVVPALFRRRVFDVVHGLSHPRIRTTRRLLTSKFVWPCIAADAASWARACVPCQQSKAKALTTVSRILASPPRRRPIHAVAGSHSGERYISAFHYRRAAAELGQPAGVDLGGIPLSRAPQIFRRNTRFARTVIRPDYQLLPRIVDLGLGLGPLY